ncbi:MAG: phage tail tube protein [Oscillospiraceae bacterium]|nr:phage tail tube protein [Oscillospiraceae bacterium]
MATKAAKMKATDSVYGALATCWVTLDGNRYNMMNLYKFESKTGITLAEVPILGEVQKGHKPAGTKNTWTGTAHYNQSAFRAWLKNYKETGILTPFTIQVTNEDKGTTVGRQTITHTGCLIDTLVLAKYEAGENVLDEDISGTFEDWDMPEKFKELPGSR